MSRAACLGLGILAGLVAGFILGSLLRGDPESTGDSSAGLPFESVASHEAAQGGVGASVTPITTGEFARSIEALADVALPAPSEPAEGGEITGMVIAADGSPVAGALVRAIPHDSGLEPTPEGAQPAATGDLRERIRRLAVRERRAHERERRAVTDPGGRYVLTGIGSGPHRVACSAGGFEVGAEDDEIAWSAIAGRRVNFVAYPITEVAVEVLLPDGSSPAEARVAVFSDGLSFSPYEEGYGDWNSSRRWTPEKTRLRLSSGVNALTATTEDEAFASPQVPVFVGPEGSHGADPIVLRLEAQTRIEGRVVLPPGVDATLYSLWLEAPGESKVELSYRNQYAREIAGLEGGVFKFTELDPGDYRIVVSLAGQGKILSEPVTVQKGQRVERVLKVSTLPDLAGIVVRVFGPGDRPLPGASVLVGGDSWYGYCEEEDTADYDTIPRPDGSFVLYRVTPGDDRPAPRWIHVSTPTFGKRLVPFPGSGASEISVRMEIPGQLEVRVSGGDPVTLEAGIALHACPPAKDGSTLVAQANLDGGRALVAPLQPGVYELRLHGSGWDGAWSAEAGTRLAVATGANHVTLAPPVIHRLTVLQAGRHGPAFLQRRVSGEWIYAGYAYPDEAGSVSFEALSAGEYRISRRGQDERLFMPITVPCGPVVFRPRIPKALRIAVDPEGVLVASGLRVGDLVTGVSGRPFVGDRSPWTILGGFLTAEATTTLTVRRGGGTLEIPVNSSDVSEAILAAGVLDPVFE